MSVAKTEYLRDKLLNWMKGTSFSAAPGTTYCALFTTAPTDAYTSGSPTGTEVSGDGYARQAITWGSVTDTSGTGSTITNSAQLSFPTDTTANWGTIVAVGIFDASTAGNLLYFGNLTASQSVAIGNQFIIAASALTIQES